MGVSLNMTYPSEYSLSKDEIIKVGDLIWYNEGTGVGFIYEIITKPQDWGLEEAGIMIQSLHPTQAKEKECSPGLHFNSEDQLCEEGIAKLSEHEKAELNYAITTALKQFNSGYSYFTVSAYQDMKRTEDWHIKFFTEDRIHNTIRIPFRTNIRTKNG